MEERLSVLYYDTRDSQKVEGYVWFIKNPIVNKVLPPPSLNSSELQKKVRIASFSDTFDALTINLPHQPSFTWFAASEVIRHRFLGHLDKWLL